MKCGDTVWFRDRIAAPDGGWTTQVLVGKVVGMECSQFGAIINRMTVQVAAKDGSTADYTVLPGDVLGTDARNKVADGWFYRTLDDAVQEYLKNTGGDQYLAAKYELLLPAVKVLVEAQGKELHISGPCTWTEDENGQWSTACGEEFEFTEGGVEENNMRYCPYCGARVKAVRYETPIGEDPEDTRAQQDPGQHDQRDQYAEAAEQETEPKTTEPLDPHVAALISWIENKTMRAIPGRFVHALRAAAIREIKSPFPDVTIPGGDSCGGCHFNNAIVHRWDCCVFDVGTDGKRCDECREALPHGGTLHLVPDVKP